MLITESNRKHYVAIKSLSRLLSSQKKNIMERGTFARIAYKDFGKNAPEMNMQVIAKITSR